MGGNGESDLSGGLLSWRFPRLTQPRLPPFADTEDRSAAVIFTLCPVRVAHDHGKDPEECGRPCKEQNGNAEERREYQDEDGHADGVVSTCIGQRRGLIIRVELGVDPLGGGGAV